MNGLSKPKEQRVFQRGLCAQAQKSKLKSSPGPAILLDMYGGLKWGRWACALAFSGLRICWFKRCACRPRSSVVFNPAQSRPAYKRSCYFAFEAERVDQQSETCGEGRGRDDHSSTAKVHHERLECTPSTPRTSPPCSCLIVLGVHTYSFPKMLYMGKRWKSNNSPVCRRISWILEVKWLDFFPEHCRNFLRCTICVAWRWLWAKNVCLASIF